MHYVQGLGADTVIDYRVSAFDEVVPPVDVVLDMVGGDTQLRSFKVVKPGGILVSVVSKPVPDGPQTKGIRTAFFLVEVTTERLDRITA